VCNSNAEPFLEEQVPKVPSNSTLKPVTAKATLIPTKTRRNAGTKTRLKAAQEALIASELRYRRLFEAAQDGILILDIKTGVITDANPFLIKLLDYTQEEIVGKALWDIGLFKDIESSKNAFLELKDKNYVRYDDLPLETKDGRSINVEFVSNVYGVKNKKSHSVQHP
jgi:PAS domain S-box-containing protein